MWADFAPARICLRRKCVDSSIFKAYNKYKSTSVSKRANNHMDKAIKDVATGSTRNEEPLTRKQIDELKQYSIRIGMPKEQIRYGEHYKNLYS